MMEREWEDILNIKLNILDTSRAVSTTAKYGSANGLSSLASQKKVQKTL